MNQDLTQTLAARVASAQAEGRPLRIQGGGTKTWLGRAVSGEPLVVGGHRGILSYEPTELVITARAGTPLAEIQAALAERGQWLAFEPPHFSPATGLADDPLDAGAGGRPGKATLGGTIACGLSGPARPYSGAARDFVLGVRLINGKGEVLRFGGEVMKNVAGYDLSRLMAGAQGTLGVLLDVSLKVLPRPAVELTLVFDLSPAEAIRRFNQWAGQPLPMSAACHDGERAYVRLAGNEAAVRAAQARLGGEVFDGEAEGFWRAVRELRHPFFRQGSAYQPGTAYQQGTAHQQGLAYQTGTAYQPGAAAPLWRLSLPPAAPHDPALGPQFIDWGGAQRWVYCKDPLWSVAQAAGGHASRYGLTFARQDAGAAGGDDADAAGAAGAAGATGATGATGAAGAPDVSGSQGPGAGPDRTKEQETIEMAGGAVFQPLPPALLALHRRLKAALDPVGILNPGRLYPEL
jgi:glycolate oxidase FAD binding subunit